MPAKSSIVSLLILCRAAEGLEPTVGGTRHKVEDSLDGMTVHRVYNIKAEMGLWYISSTEMTLRSSLAWPD